MVEPDFDLLLLGFLVKLWWRVPGVVDTSHGWVFWILDFLCLCGVVRVRSKGDGWAVARGLRPAAGAAAGS